MSKLKDTDYLSISTRVRAMEKRLLTHERMEQMIDARTHEDALKILLACGYGEVELLSIPALDAVIAKARSAVFYDLRNAVPNPVLLDVFQLKYDYHNAKVLIKAQAKKVEANHLLLAGGRYTPSLLVDAFGRSDFRELTSAFGQAIVQAQSLLTTTSDPQQVDFLLDRAYFAEMRTAAQALDSDFLLAYVRLNIDAVNLRTVVRATRMGKSAAFLAQVLIPEGNVAVRQLSRAKASDLPTLFRVGCLAQAAACGAEVALPHGGSLTQFERLCDNALLQFLAQARRIPFGEQPIIGYLHAREAESTAIRIIFAGRLAGLSGDTIRERLRDTYA